MLTKSLLHTSCLSVSRRFAASPTTLPVTGTKNFDSTWTTAAKAPGPFVWICNLAQPLSCKVIACSPKSQKVWRHRLSRPKAPHYSRFTSNEYYKVLQSRLPKTRKKAFRKLPESCFTLISTTVSCKDSTSPFMPTTLLTRSVDLV